MTKEREQIVYSRKLLDNSDIQNTLEYMVDRLGGFKDKMAPGDTVLIKPNFVAPFPKATTDLAFIDFFINKIRERGAIPVVGESSGYEFGTEGTFDILGIRSFLKDRDVKLINFEEDEYIKTNIGSGFEPVEIAKSAIQAKLIINLSVLKGHSITRVTGATKNLFGFLSKPSRRYLHFHRLEEGIAALARKFTNIIHIVDARFLLTRAVFGQLEPLGYCLAGENPFNLDHYGARLLGVTPESIKYLSGVGDYEVDGDKPDAFRPGDSKNSFKERIRRFLYSAFYRLDHIKCAVFGGKSIIPHLHWYLGVHPEIGQISEERLKELANKCPVGAISVKGHRIVKDKCLKVRCLKCYCESERGEVVLKGFGRPKEIKK